MNQHKRGDIFTISYGVFSILPYFAYVMGLSKICAGADCATFGMGIVVAVLTIAMMGYAKVLLLHMSVKTNETWCITTWQVMCSIEIFIVLIVSWGYWLTNYHDLQDPAYMTMILLTFCTIEVAGHIFFFYRASNFVKYHSKQTLDNKNDDSPPMYVLSNAKQCESGTCRDTPPCSGSKLHVCIDNTDMWQYL